MAVRAHLPYRILRTVIGDLATPYRPETVVRELGANFEDVGVCRRHPVEDRHFFFHQRRPVDRAFQVLHRISRSSNSYVRLLDRKRLDDLLSDLACSTTYRVWDHMAVTYVPGRLRQETDAIFERCQNSGCWVLQ